MRTVRLYGEAGRRFGTVHQLDVASPAEAVRALCSQHKGATKYFRGHHFAVFTGKVNIGAEEVGAPVGRGEAIKIVPVVSGGSNGLKIVAGAVLIVVGAVISAYGGGAGAPLMKMGFALMLGGIAGALSQAATAPTAAKALDEPTNYTFGSPKVTTGQGNPVPICYGKHRVGGCLISSGIDSEAYQSLGFGGFAPDDGGTQGGDGNATPWAWSIAPEDDDSASGISEQLRFIQALSEGPILGLANGLKSVYLDGTPVQSISGSFNVHGISMAMVSGTANQAAIPGFPSIETPYDVGVQVTKDGGAIARTITTEGLSAVRIRMRYPSMQTIDKATGDVTPATAQIAVTIQNSSYNGGAPEAVRLSGDGICKIKSASAYTKAWRVDLPQGYTGGWTISVSRVTDDSTSNYLLNDTYWSDYTELTDDLLRYPYTSLIGVSIDAKSFSSVPELTAEIRGRVVQVPENYDPETRVYTGLWNGTFKWAWTDNPAWCWYDLATNTRYGAGAFLTASLDKWSLYEIGQWCDVMVPNGLGGLEPRMACNIYIQSQAEAIQMLSELASVFWGIVYYSSGYVTAVADWEKEPVALFTNANVKDGEFQYAGSAKKARHTSAVVTWVDPNLGYGANQEIYEYEDARIRYGYNPLTVTAVACTSRGQARRFGQWSVITEYLCTDTVSFTAGLDGSLVVPGDLFQVQDNHLAGSVKWGGRTAPGSTTSSICVDREVVLSPGYSYYLRVWLEDGTVATRQIMSPAGTWLMLEVDPLPSAPGPGAVWMVQRESESATYRAISVTENGMEFDVVGLLHDSQVYDLVGVGNDFEDESQDNPEYPRPVNLAAGVAISATSGVLSVRVSPSWSAPLGYSPSTYELAYRYNGGAWTSAYVQGLGAEITGHGLGLYEFRCFAIYRTHKSAPDTWSTVAEITGNPPDVTGLTWAYRDDAARLSWDAVEDGRGVSYEVRLGSTWETGMVLGRGDFLTYDAVAAGTYWVSAYFMGLYSDTPTSIVIPASALTQNIVQTWNEQSTSWPGSFSGAAAADGLGAVYLTGAGLTGAYEVPASHVVDIGTPQPCRVSVAYQASTTNLNNDWDSQADFDAWADVDGLMAGYGSVLIQIALSQDGSTWGDWQTFIPGTYLARRFKVRAVLTRADTTVTQYLNALSWTVDMPDRVEKGTGVAVGTGGLAVTFSTAFQIIPNVQITITNMQAGDVITFPVSPSASGFTVRITNGGSGVARTVNWQALGY